MRIKCVVCKRYVPTVSDGTCDQCDTWRKYLEERPRKKETDQYE